MSNEERYKMALEAIIEIRHQGKSGNWLDIAFACSNVAERALYPDGKPK